MYALVIEQYLDYMIIIKKKTKLCPDIEVWIYFQDSQLNKCKDINKHDKQLDQYGFEFRFFLSSSFFINEYIRRRTAFYSFILLFEEMNYHCVLYLIILVSTVSSATPNCPVEGRRNSFEGGFFLNSFFPS